MKNQKIVSHKQKLDALFAKTKDLNSDAELIAHWSRYLCVLVSGFVEASVRTLIADYATSRSSPEIAHFVGTKLKIFTNAKTNKILDLVAEFGNDFREELAKVLTDELKDSVDSVVSNRHLIAHGQDVGIGIATIKKYYSSVVTAVEELEKQFANQRFE
jgi:hypothetical protein